MIKVKQKISDSFRTFESAELFDIIHSYISTMRKQGRPIFQDLNKSGHYRNFFSFPLLLDQNNISARVLAQPPHNLSNIRYNRKHTLDGSSSRYGSK